MVEFGRVLRKLRKEKKLTQKQLTAMLGVKNTIISFYETGDRFPSVENIVKLSAIFQVSTDFLLGVEKNESVDISKLEEADKGIVRSLIYSLALKNNSQL